MRVIAGIAKGLKLEAPKTQKVRPATDKVKGALFNILGDLEGAKVLDLFAGSGSVGIEALSRGASQCIFVEADRQIASYLQKNLNHCHFDKVGEVLCTKVDKAISLLSKKEKFFHLVFVDPPYDQDLVNPSLSLLEASPLLQNEAIVVVEHSPRESIALKEKLEIIDERRYGQTLITFLKFNCLPS